MTDAENMGHRNSARGSSQVLSHFTLFKVYFFRRRTLKRLIFPVHQVCPSNSTFSPDGILLANVSQWEPHLPGRSRASVQFWAPSSTVFTFPASETLHQTWLSAPSPKENPCGWGSWNHSCRLSPVCTCLSNGLPVEWVQVSRDCECKWKTHDAAEVTERSLALRKPWWILSKIMSLMNCPSNRSGVPGHLHCNHAQQISHVWQSLSCRCTLQRAHGCPDVHTVTQLTDQPTIRKKLTSPNRRSSEDVWRSNDLYLVGSFT